MKNFYKSVRKKKSIIRKVRGNMNGLNTYFKEEETERCPDFLMKM